MRQLTNTNGSNGVVMTCITLRQLQVEDDENTTRATKIIMPARLPSLTSLFASPHASSSRSASTVVGLGNLAPAAGSHKVVSSLLDQIGQHKLTQNSTNVWAEVVVPQREEQQEEVTKVNFQDQEAVKVHRSREVKHLSLDSFPNVVS
jgi:hypothetical protein